MAAITPTVLFFLASVILTIPLAGLVIRYAFSHKRLDIPDERSSHELPTPTGGGVAIVASWLATTVGMMVLGIVDFGTVYAIGPPALLISAVGFVDDRRKVSPWVRLLVQCTAAIWVLYFLNGPPLFGFAWVDDRPWLGYLFGGLGLVWLINLFNFMDGIDGLAGSEAVFVALGSALIAVVLGVYDSASLIGVVLAGACIGFLYWNWPPAKIFMGDVGCTYLGFVLGAIVLTSSGVAEIRVWPWVTLFCVFLVDATVTLIRRFLSGQRWFEPHRTHAYQKLATRWSSHKLVTLVVIGINVCWLLPLSLWAAVQPAYSAAITGFAALPLIGLVLWIGAGRVETS